MFIWDMSVGSFTGLFTTEPVYDVPFGNAAKPLADFLTYLEGRGHVQPQIECHTVKRAVGKDASAMPTFTVKNVEKVGFKVKGTDKNPKAVFSTLTPDVFGASSKVVVVCRCKFDEKESLIVPQRPVVMPKAVYRVPAKTIIKLNNL